MTKAQMSSFEGNFYRAKQKQGETIYTNIGINLRAHFSVLDILILNNPEKKFMFGDLWGVKGDFGWGKKKVYWQGILEDKIPYMHVALGFSAGAFVGYNNSNFGFFLKYQKDLYSSYVSDFSTRMNIYTFSGMLYNTYYFEFSKGVPLAKLNNSQDGKDSQLHFAIRYYTVEGDEEYTDEYIGLSIDLTKKTDELGFISNFNVFGITYGITFH